MMPDSRPANPYHAFIADCENLLASRGAVLAFAGVNGYGRTSARVLDTPGLYIAAGEGKELEITIRYTDIRTGRQTENPVAGRDAQGDLYRTHGEWVYGIKRVERLLAGETPDAPIRVDMSADSGYKSGLD